MWAFQYFCLSLDFSELFQLAKRDTPHNVLIFQLPSEGQIREGKFFRLSSLNLADIPYNSDAHKILELVYAKYICPKVDSF